MGKWECAFENFHLHLFDLGTTLNKRQTEIQDCLLQVMLAELVPGSPVFNKVN